MHSQKQLSEVTSTEPCIHCGKGDWCYRFSNGASVCNRGQIATGWEESGKTDKNGAAILYPIEWEKKKPKPQVVTTQEWIYKGRNGDDLVKVTRQNLDDGSKKIYQSFWSGSRWLSKCPSTINRPDIPIYRYMEIKTAVHEGEIIFVVEGEKVADKLVSMGLSATTNIRGSQSYSDSDIADLAGAKQVVLCPDKDKPGMKLMKKWEKGLTDAGITVDWLYAFPQTRWDNLPDSQGLDLYDWIVQFQVTRSELIAAIGHEPDGLKPTVKTSTPLQEVSEYDDSDSGEKAGGTYDDPDLRASIRAFKEVYGSGHYVAVEGKLHKFNGKFYELLDSEEEKKNFSHWAATHPYIDKKTGRWILGHMTNAFVEECWKWTLGQFAINPKRINPPGINLDNGVLRVEFSGKKAKWRLDPHSPTDIYLSCSEVAFNPDADLSHADRLLQALDPEPRKIFLRTVAAAIDLGHVRKILGRGVRAALCRGNGNNGKDSLREVVTAIFGSGQVAIATLSDFTAYDQGRKYDLAQLQGRRINWPSENNKETALDKSASLNCAITGDPLIYEIKREQGFPFTCNAVHFFNCNKIPQLKGGLESIKSRICVLHFSKTYSDRPKPERGELLADPRFKYDREWVIKEVCPAFLNLMLAELEPLLNEGINYGAIEHELQDVQEESTHLWEFCKDVAIEPSPDGRIYVHDLWYKLQCWYEENGTLERADKPDGGYTNIWHDQANKWDRNITGPNQIFKRFKELFPKIEKRRETLDPEFKGRFYLAGLSANSASLLHYPDKSSISASPSASLCFTNDDSASLNDFSSDQESVKQKVKQNATSENAETLTASTGEAVKQNPKLVSDPEKLSDEQLAEFLGHIDDLKRKLAWEPAKFRAFCQFQTGKNKPSELSFDQAAFLWNALIIESEKLQP